MKTINKLPKSAKYDYTDICGYKHYHTARRIYLKWNNRNGIVIRSYGKNEEF